jgi:hypothetical protein
MANNARIPNVEPSIAAGIPLTKKTNMKAVKEFIEWGNSSNWRKENIRKQLRILDEQDAVNRYKWYNLPCDISSQELERLIYYRGQLCFFYVPSLEQYVFSPYALDGTIDYYGRYNTVHPVPWAEGMDNEKKSPMSAYLANMKLDVLYGIPAEEDKLIAWIKKFTEGKACVLVHDYTKQLSQNIIARQIIQDPLLDIMSDCIPFMRTCLLAGTGVKGMRISNQADYPNVLDANAAFEKAALEGDPYVPIVGSVDFQTLTDGQILKAEEFLLSMQGLDNYRLSLYGLDNGGLFQKKSHMLEAEQSMNAGKAAIPLNDGLSIRQYFADVVNALTGLGISVGIAEEVINADMNGDGMAYDDLDQSGEISGEQPHDANYTGIEGGSQY